MYVVSRIMPPQITARASAYSLTSLSRLISLYLNILVRVGKAYSVDCVEFCEQLWNALHLSFGFSYRFFDSLYLISFISEIKKIVIIDLDVHQGNGW